MTLHIIIPTCGNVCLLDMLRGRGPSPGGFMVLPHDRPELEFVLVMNGEGLESQVTFETARDWLVQHFRCRYAYLPNRIGYVRAIDWGWKLAEPAPGDYVAVLNDDVVITGDWITPLVEALEQYPRAQVGPSLMTLRPDGLGSPTGQWHPSPSAPRFHYHYIEGWCWMARAETITQAGGIADLGFDGTYCEDCDLSIRICESGGEILRIPCTLSEESNPIHHIGHGSSSPEMMAQWVKNRQYLAQKWDLLNGGRRATPNLSK